MKIAVFVSGGGHLDEALCAVEGISGHEWILVTYRQKSLEGFKHPFFKKTVFLSLYASWGPLLYLSLLINCAETFWFLLKNRPDAVFSTGSEIAVAPFYLSRYCFRIPCIFLETVTRFRSPSQTARWIYGASDLFLLQWPELLGFFGPKAEFHGKIF